MTNGEFMDVPREAKLVIFSSPTGEYFAEKLIANIPEDIAYRGWIERKNFRDGERYLRIPLRTRNDLIGKDVVYVSPTNQDDDLLELYRVGCKLASLGTRRRIFVIPFLGYSTMERAVKPGEVVTAKENCRLLSAIPNNGVGNVFIFMDLHVQGLLNYFEGPCSRMELYAEPVLLDGIRTMALNKGEFMFASADLGRPLWVSSFAKKFDTEIAFVQKERNFEITRMGCVIGKVKGKHVVIYDDMTRTGGTLIQAAAAYLHAGATSVHAVLSHAAFATPEVVEKLEKSDIATFITTNTHPATQWESVKRSKKFVILDVSKVYADAIIGTQGCPGLLPSLLDRMSFG
eukprot:Clim_evm42s210 gene=Clim_evmTU42s210